MAGGIDFAIVQLLLLVIACCVASCAHSLKRMAPRPPAPDRERAIFAAIGVLAAYFK
jgi:hypothetical protein